GPHRRRRPAPARKSLVIGMTVNAGQFHAELEKELKGVEEATTDFTKEVALELRQECEDRSPRGKTLKLTKSWAVSVGKWDKTIAEGSAAQAEAALASLRPGQSVFVQSTDFVAGFFENGTVHMSPRPIAAPAIAAVSGMEKRA
ncbi:MAG: hypothetical protein ABI639_17625, partial [Thermoanaerobaculia bacterium]